VKLPEGVTPVIKNRDFTIATIAGALKGEEEAAAVTAEVAAAPAAEAKAAAPAAKAAPAAAAKAAPAAKPAAKK
jgi:large subunit ribosomal protein L25